MLVCLLPVACSSSVPAVLALSYSVTGCEKPLRETRSRHVDEVEITAEGNVIHVEQTLTHVCCAELVLTVEQEGNVLRIIETNTGDICRCICEYQVQANLVGVDPGTYQVEVWGVRYEDVHPLELLGKATAAL